VGPACIAPAWQGLDPISRADGVAADATDGRVPGRDRHAASLRSRGWTAQHGDALVLAELVDVLEPYYERPRDEVANAARALVELPAVECDQELLRTSTVLRARPPSRQVVTRSGVVASVEVMSYALCWQRSCVACQESVAAGRVAGL
jgi:hypothetical protein